MVNIFSATCWPCINNVSVWWHVFGAAVVVADPVFVPRSHQSLVVRLHRAVNNTGFFGGTTSGRRSGSTCCRSASCSPSTRSPATTPPRTCPRRPRARPTAPPRASGSRSSTPAIGGWILLLAFLFAVQDVGRVTGGRRRRSALDLQPGADAASGQASCCSSPRSGQFFCTDACMTSTHPDAVRVQPRRRRAGRDASGRRLNTQPRAGQRASSLAAVVGAVLTLPALVKVDINGAPVPVAFFAVVSIGVIGLYLAFAIPIYLRWRAGDTLQAGPVDLGHQVQVDGPVAVVEIVDHSIVSLLPDLHRRRARGTTDSRGSTSTTRRSSCPGALIALWICWHALGRSTGSPGRSTPSTSPFSTPRRDDSDHQ